MRINRRRTRYPEHVKLEIQREKMKMLRECESIMPIFANEAWKEISDPSVVDDLIDPHPSPESELISKDIFKTFSDEAKEVAKIILSCPEEFFLMNGRIKKSLLRHECKEKLGWGPRKTDSITFEIGLMLRHTIA